METVVAKEGSMDNILDKKIVDAVKRYMNDAVTLVEGFVSVQINGSDFHHVHISYRDLSLDPDDNTSVSDVVSPQPAVPKVSRRKAYLPIKCRTPVNNETEAPMLESSPTKDDAHQEHTFHGENGKELEGCRLEKPLSRTSHLQHLLLPGGSSSSDEHPSLTQPGFASMDNDAIGLLNPESIQASMHQVMQPSYPGMLPTDLCLSSMALNSVIPIPAVQSVNNLKPKQHLEQRKIKPKPIGMNATGLNKISPYAKPSQVLTKRNPNKEFTCNQCQLKFKSLLNLTEHTTSVHVCFRCTTCNAKFTQRSNLQRHSLKHLGFKPFRCAVCLKEYYRKDHLVRHVEVSHPGSEPKASIVNILPSAECLRILEETQSNQAEQDRMKSDTPSTVSADPPISESVNHQDLLINFAFSTAANCLTIPVMEDGDSEDYKGFVNLTEGSRESEDGDDIEDEDDFGMEDDALIFEPHLALPLSHSSPGGSSCSVVNNMTS